MRCQDVREELIAYLNDELIDEKKDAIESHLVVCSACAREMVEIKKMERAIKNGLESWAKDGEEVHLTEWLKKSKKLSDKEREERKEFVAEVTKEKPVPKKNWQNVIRFGAAALILVMLLTSYWPQAVKASTQMPWVGPWIQELVLRDAGLSWAYEHGYMDGSWVSVKEDGVEFTILGVIADPVQTTVIYLVDGMAQMPSVYISEVNGEGASSWTSPGIETSLGVVGMTQTNPLPEGEHTLTVVLTEQDFKERSMTNKFSLEIVADREDISRLSTSYELDQEITFDGITVKANRVVYTPTQIMVEYTVNGGTGLHGSIPKEYRTYLLTGDGERLYSVRGQGSSPTEDVRELYNIFERPADTSDLTMVIPVQGNLEEISVELTRPDTFRVLDTNLRLGGWTYDNNMFEIDMYYEKYSKVMYIDRWLAMDNDGNTEELNSRNSRGEGFSGYENPGDFAWVSTKYELEIGQPVKLIATRALVVVEGNWEFKLPDIE